MADSEKIRRVVHNLLDNALKYTPRGGTVRASAAETEHEVLVAVRDSGEGIPEHLRERIFDKFAQAEAAREGRRLSVGLGLAFCRLALEAHGRRIWVDSVPGAGSTFTFALPSARKTEGH